MHTLTQNSGRLKSVGGILVLISCYETGALWIAGLLGWIGISVSMAFLGPISPFINAIREPLFFVALALFSFGSLRQGIPALTLALSGGLLLYIGYYVYPGNLPLLLGAVALTTSYFVGRRGNSKPVSESNAPAA